RNVHRTRRLNQYSVAAVEQHAREHERVRMHERLATRQLHDRCADLLDSADDGVQLHALPAMKGIGGVAPYAPQRAARQPHEGAGNGGPGGFALDRMKDLRHSEKRHGAVWYTGGSAECTDDGG